MLHNNYKTEDNSAEVAWIYDYYSNQLQRDLVASKRLATKGLQHVIAGLVPLLYGNIRVHNHLLTAELYSSIPARHRRGTTWRRLVD